MQEWYRKLRKSKLNPPDWVFKVVWPVLYGLMATSLVLFSVKGGFQSNWLGAYFFFLQLFLNIAWSFIFFGWHNLGLSFVIILLLDALVALTIWKFFDTSDLSAYLLIPYLAWIVFATYLAWVVYHKN